MSHSTSAVSTSSPSSYDAELLEKIRQAEVDSAARLESAKKEAEAIVAKAREEASALIQQAEENARWERERIFSEGRKSIGEEIRKIRAETLEQVKSLKEKTQEPKGLKELVLSILEE